eukprot:scaffold16068_cov62-Phaeocystis_antarctica.AAC.1
MYVLRVGRQLGEGGEAARLGGPRAVHVEEHRARRRLREAPQPARLGRLHDSAAHLADRGEQRLLVLGAREGRAEVCDGQLQQQVLAHVRQVGRHHVALAHTQLAQPACELPHALVQLAVRPEHLLPRSIKGKRRGRGAADGRQQRGHGCAPRPR